MPQIFPYSCELEISFPSSDSADRHYRVLSVDEEVGDRVKKSLKIASEDPKTMIVSFQATEAKMLRVAVSTFCDYLTVALKCEQEFGNNA